MRLGLVPLLIVVIAAGPAHANDADEARAESQKALGAYGLGDYAAAAQHYEAAFRLKPDGALLFNAAQAFRLAGNKRRALELYRNYVRLYNEHARAQEAKRHIATLEKEVAGEAGPLPVPSPPPPAPVAANPAPAAVPKPAAPPPPSVAPAPASPPATTVALAAPPPAGNPPQATLVAPAGQAPPAQRSRHTAVWVVLGLAVAAGVVAAVVVLNPSYPNAGFGKAAGN